MSCGTPGLTCLLAEKANLEKRGNRKNQNLIHMEAFHSGSNTTVTLTTPLLQNINVGINLDFSILKLVA